MLLHLIFAWLAACVHGFAPIQWVPVHSRRYVVSLRKQPNRALVPPQRLTIVERPRVKHDGFGSSSGTADIAKNLGFTANLDATITWDALGWCLEAVGINTGDAVRVNRCTGESTQKWTWVPNGFGQLLIQLQGTNQCISVQRLEGDLDGAPIELRECSKEVTEAWDFEGRIPLPTQTRLPSIARSRYLPHVILASTVMGVLLAASIAVRMRRWQKSADVPAESVDALPLDVHGISLATPLTMHQGTVLSSTRAARSPTPAMMAARDGEGTKAIGDPSADNGEPSLFGVMDEEIRKRSEEQRRKQVARDKQIQIDIMKQVVVANTRQPSFEEAARQFEIKRSEEQRRKQVARDEQIQIHRMARATAQLIFGKTHQPSLEEVARQLDREDHNRRGDQYYVTMNALYEIRQKNDLLYTQEAFPSMQTRMQIEALADVNYVRTSEGRLCGDFRQRGPDGMHFVTKIDDPSEPKSAYIQAINTKFAEDDLLMKIDKVISGARERLKQDPRAPVGEENFIKLLRDDGFNSADGYCKILAKLGAQVVKRQRLGEAELTARTLWSRIVRRTDELYQVAECLGDAYELALLELLRRADLDFSNMKKGPLKDPVRVYEKAMDDYTKEGHDLHDGVLPEAWVGDMLRCSIMVDDAASMLRFQKLLAQQTGEKELGGQAGNIKLLLLRTKNKFAKPGPTHFRYILNSVMLIEGSLSSHVEIQLHHKLLFALDVNLNSHYLYNFFRDTIQRQSSRIENEKDDKQIERRVELYEQSLCKYGLDYSLKNSPRYKKDVPEKLTMRTKTQLVILNSLQHDIPRLLRSEPNWDTFAEDFELVAPTGAKIRGLETFKKLIHFLQRVSDEFLVEDDIQFSQRIDDSPNESSWRGVRRPAGWIKISPAPRKRGERRDPENMWVRWRVQVRSKQQQPFFIFNGDHPVVTEAFVMLLLNDKNQVGCMQIKTWHVNEREFPLWPQLNLSDDYTTNLAALKEWVQRVNKVMSMTPVLQELVAKGFEEARRESPGKSPVPEMNVQQRCASEVFVVDFGSGSTRANLVRWTADGSVSSERVKGFKGIPLQKALSTVQSMKKLVTDIAQAIPAGNILAGGTEGVRLALESGSINQEQVDSFSEMLTSDLGPRIKFDILTPEQEAEAEWKSVAYALQTMEQLPDLQDSKGIIPGWNDVSGMLSAGGISCQLAVRSMDGHELGFRSFRNLIGRMEEFMEIRGIICDDGLEAPSAGLFNAFRQSYEDRIRKNVVATMPSDLEGIYILTELWRSLSYKSPNGPGINPYQAILVSDASDVIDEWLDNALVSPEPILPSKATMILLATVAKVVFKEMFHPDARVCFMGGTDMNWSIGWALENPMLILPTTTTTPLA